MAGKRLSFTEAASRLGSDEQSASGPPNADAQPRRDPAPARFTPADEATAARMLDAAKRSLAPDSREDPILALPQADGVIGKIQRIYRREHGKPIPNRTGYCRIALQFAGGETLRAPIQLEFAARALALTPAELDELREIRRMVRQPPSRQAA